LKARRSARVPATRECARWRGVSELRINYGPGYRVYFRQRGRDLIILLAGGDKRTQAQNIKTALRLARDLSE
ncbi:MAG: type II toxin-antitoxin system RelE/ParE family toxin, partial [Verrucomicrobiota bacterium]